MSERPAVKPRVGIERLACPCGFRFGWIPEGDGWHCIGCAALLVLPSVLQHRAQSWSAYRRANAPAIDGDAAADHWSVQHAYVAGYAAAAARLPAPLASPERLAAVRAEVAKAQKLLGRSACCLSDCEMRLDQAEDVLIEVRALLDALLTVPE